MKLACKIVLIVCTVALAAAAPQIKVQPGKQVYTRLELVSGDISLRDEGIIEGYKKTRMRRPRPQGGTFRPRLGAFYPWEIRKRDLPGMNEEEKVAWAHYEGVQREVRGDAVKGDEGKFWRLLKMLIVAFENGVVFGEVGGEVPVEGPALEVGLQEGTV